MVLWLIIGALVALAFALLGRALARRKGRQPFAWGLAAAIVPPALLVLLLLPARKAA